MRTTTAAWAAALAVMSMHGPFTTAEAAPARLYEPQRPKNIIPKHVRREGYNASSAAVQSSSSSSSEYSDSFASPLFTPEDTPPPATPDLTPTTATTFSRRSTRTPRNGPASVLDSLISKASSLVGTGNVVTGTDTYTITHTETSLPAAESLLSVPLTSSVSVSASTVPPSSTSEPPVSLHGPLSHIPHHSLRPTGQLYSSSSSSSSSSSAPVVQSPHLSPHLVGPPPSASSASYSVNSTQSRVLSSEASTPASAGGQHGPPVLGSTVGLPSDIIPPSSGLHSPHHRPTGHVRPTPSSQYNGSESASGSSAAAGSSAGFVPKILPSPKHHGPLSGIPNIPHGGHHGGTGTGGYHPNGVRPTPPPSSSGGVIVGVSHIIHHTGNHPLSNLGLTGAPTGSLPNILPTGSASASAAPGVFPNYSNFPNMLTRLSALSEAGVNATRLGPKRPAGTGTGIIPNILPTPRPNVVTPVMSGATNGVNSVLSDLTNNVTEAASTALSNVTGIAGVPVKTTDVVSDVLSSVQSEVTAAAGKDPVSSIEQSLNSKLSDIAATVTDPAVVSSIADGFTSIVTSVASDATQTVDSVVNSATDTIVPVVNSATDTVGSVVNSATDTIGSVVNSATDTAGSIVNSATDTAGSVVNSATDTGALSIPSPTSTVTAGDSTVTPAPSTTTATPTTPSPTTPSTTDNVTPIATPDSTTTTTDGSTASEATPTETPSDSTLTTSIPLTSDGTPTVQTVDSTTSTSSRPSPPAETPNVVTPTATTSTVTDSIVPTGTDAATKMTLPTTWTFAPKLASTTEPNPASLALASSTTNTPLASGIPAFMPKLVQPPGGLPVAPANFSLVQVGFAFGLNYPFVISQPDSASQIFLYLPQGIAHGLGISHDQVIMAGLSPYDTSQTLNYITTLAQAYVPGHLATQLQLDLHTAGSRLYSNPHTPVQQLMDMINPTLPFATGPAMDGVAASVSYNPAAPTSKSDEDAAPIGGDSGSAKAVKGTSVGIGLGAIGGAAVYAAAMMYVARRYRQRRKRHQRASSVPHREMSQVSGGGMGSLFMSGANGRGSAPRSGSGSAGRGSRTSAGSSNGRSVREQGISAPLYTENSLGWN